VSGLEAEQAVPDIANHVPRVHLRLGRAQARAHLAAGSRSAPEPNPPIVVTQVGPGGARRTASSRGACASPRLKALARRLLLPRRRGDAVEVPDDAPVAERQLALELLVARENGLE